MSQSPDLVRHFRAAPWRTPQEIRTFATEVSPVPAAELARLVPLLTDRGLAGEPRGHRNRCQAFAALVERAPAESLFVPCVRALEGSDPVLRATLVPLIPKVNNVGAHRELCLLLGSSDAEVRRVAAKVLRDVGGKSALDALIPLAEKPDFPGRLDALEAFLGRAGQHAFPLVAAALRLGAPAERIQALRYLSEDERLVRERGPAMRVVAPALEDPDERVAAQAIVAFAALASEDEFFQQMGPRIDDPSLNVVRAVIEALRRYRSPRVVAVLGRKLRLGPNPIRIAVLDALAAMGGDEVISLLVEALGHRQQGVRNRAAEVLWQLNQLGQVDLARTVLWLLRSRDVNVRRMAVELARKIGDPDGQLTPRLLKHLRDEDWWVRERVIDAVAEMLGPELTRHILPFLQDASDVVRRWAIGGLIRLKDPRSLGALIRSAMEDADWWVRERAVEAMAALGDARAIPYLVGMMQHSADLKVAALEAVATMGAAEVAPMVAECARDPDPEVRLATIRALERLGEPSLSEAVQGCINDPDPRVHRAATALLTRWNQLRAGVVTPAASGKQLDQLLLATVENQADDLVLAGGRAVYLKAEGMMRPLDERVFSAEEVEEILRPHLSREQLAELEKLRDVDFSHEVVTHELRFRANVFRQSTGLAAVFRAVRREIPALEQLGLPPVVHGFADLRDGLVLVGGPTGSGKSTTLAAIIADINRRKGLHILTFEDPIEVIHQREQSLVNQRELGTHIAELGVALRAALREDPDVILVGEMRDLATINFAITAAETGHLVFGTVHTVSADTTVDRLINAFPAGQQSQVRSVLSESLRAVVCQHLLRRADGAGRVVATEVMVNTDAIGNLIRKGKTFQIPSVIATSRETGMQSMDSDLMRLLKEGRILPDEAYVKSMEKKLFEPYLEGGVPEASDGEAAAGRAPRGG